MRTGAQVENPSISEGILLSQRRPQRVHSEWCCLLRTAVPSLLQVGRDYPPPVDLDLDLGSLDENAYRLIKYEFSEDVLRLPSIQVRISPTVDFQVCHDLVFASRFSRVWKNSKIQHGRFPEDTGAGKDHKIH